MMTGPGSINEAATNHLPGQRILMEVIIEESLQFRFW